MEANEDIKYDILEPNFDKTNETRLVYNCVHNTIKRNCFGTRRRRNQEERGEMISPERNTFAREARRRVERRKKIPKR